MNNTQDSNTVLDLNQAKTDSIHGVIKTLQTTLTAWNYAYLGTPLLEPAEIFLRKSGEAFTWETYNLVDSQGDRFALRPEFTSSVARHILQSGTASNFPIRKCYSGPVFRNDAFNKNGRQFHQVGAELVGVGTVDGDAEVVALAISSLQQLGFNNLEVTVGNVGIASNLLEQFGLSERTIALLLSRLDWLSAIDEHAEEIQLQIGRSQSLISPDPDEAGKGKTEDGAILLSLLSASDNQVIGSRTLEEIVARYLKRVGAYQDIERTQLALRFLSEFTAIHGPLQNAEQEAKLLLKQWQLDPSALGWISEFNSKLSEYHLTMAAINCDFSLTHDVRYYTGMVFEIAPPGVVENKSNVVCSGGRYDKLYRSLGALTDTPALGFAHSVETLIANQKQIPDVSDDAPFTGAGILILPIDPLSPKAALDQAAQSRKAGMRIGVLINSDPAFNLDEYARANMITQILWVGENGIEKEQDID